jgi:hypothetical protein
LPDVYLPEDIYAAVAADGIPREATDIAGSGTKHMIFLNEIGAVESCPIADWSAREAALASRTAERQQKEATRQTLHAALTPIQGKDKGQWSLPEVRDLLAILLDQAGLLGAGGGVG